MLPSKHSLCTETFQTPHGRLKVHLLPPLLLLTPLAPARLPLPLTLPLSFAAKFHVDCDAHGNPCSIVVEGESTLALCHSNPTVLQQWADLLQNHIHRTHFHDEFAATSKLGCGSSATVYAAVRKRDAVEFAVKVFPKGALGPTEVAALANEIGVMRRLPAGRFPKLEATYDSGKSYFVVMEKVQGYPLSKKAAERLSERESKLIIRQLAEAIETLGELGIVHRDIKPENVIYSKQSQTAKLVDFGFATFVQQPNHVFLHCGTPGYTAPQALDRSYSEVSPHQDVFSLGVLAHLLFCGTLPYACTASLLLDNKDCRFQFHSNLRKHPLLLDFIRRTVCRKDKRISIEEVLSHGLLREECDNPEVKWSMMGELCAINRKMEVKREVKRERRERADSVRVGSNQEKCRKSLAKFTSRMMTERF